MTFGTPVARAADERAIVLNFTPTERAQIAIWIESADGTFLNTVGLTQAVSVRGIGNRPGAAQMNSGFHWPYGRREGVLPIWAHRRASAPGAMQFPRIIFQHRPEGYASRTCEDSTHDAYYCLSFSADTTRKDALDAITCATPFNSDKGRILQPNETYSEPLTTGVTDADRTLKAGSLYPPRRDFVSCADASTVNTCMGGSSSCQDHPDSALYANKARAAMPEIDAVTMATPPADTEQTVMFSVPADVARRRLRRVPRDQHRGRLQRDLQQHRLPDAAVERVGLVGDELRLPVPRPAVGRVRDSVHARAGRDVLDDDAGRLRLRRRHRRGSQRAARHGRIDHRRSAGRAGQRRRSPPPDDATEPARLSLEVRPCVSELPPAAPTDLTAEPVADTKHSHEWAHLHFVVPPSSAGGISKYEVRVSSMAPIVEGDATSFIQGLPAQAATAKTEALMLPTDKQPGEAIDVDFGGLTPSTRYWVGVRALDSCNRPGPHAVVEMTTSKIHYTTLPPVSAVQGPVLHRDGRLGIRLEPTVSAMRRARDQLLAEVPCSRLRPTSTGGRDRPPRASSVGATPPGCSPGSCWDLSRPRPKRCIPSK